MATDEPPRPVGQVPDRVRDRELPRIEGYSVEREIGRGGTSVVYLATQHASGRRVAVKILAPELALSATAVARLDAEARAAERLEHPAIVHVWDSGRTDDLHYLVTEYIEGPSLADLLTAAPADTPATAHPGVVRRDDFSGIARCFAALADALAHSHAAGVLHRDVKPSNILFDREGRPHLADFGIARGLADDDLTRTGDAAGTLSYMSPEQCRADPETVDARTDIFSLGVVLYETLAGRRPFDRPSRLATVRAILDEDPIAPRRLHPAIPRTLESICLKCLEKDPNDRYAAALALEHDLLEFAEGRPVRVRRPSLAQRLRRSTRRRWRRVVAVAVVTGVAVVAITLGRQLRAENVTPVLLFSDPPGAQVYVRRMHFPDAAYGPPRALGTAPLRVGLEPGLVRLVFVDGQGSSAELSRTIPTRDELQEAESLEVRARLVDAERALEGMVVIGGGTITAGFGPAGASAFHEREAYVDDFALDPHEVTFAEFRRFLDDTGRPTPPLWGGGPADSLADRPAAGITWDLARDYAEWAGKRLPTWYEFERAAHGPRRGMRPWGDLNTPAESTRVWACVDRLAGRSFATSITDLATFSALVGPVGSHPRDRSAAGVYDVLGSVSEWLDTPWMTPDPAGGYVAAPGLRLLNSSNWALDERLAHLYVMTPLEPSQAQGLLSGFRCARSIDPLAQGRPQP